MHFLWLQFLMYQISLFPNYFSNTVGIIVKQGDCILLDKSDFRSIEDAMRYASNLIEIDAFDEYDDYEY